MTDLLRDRLQSSLGSAYTLERELGGGGMSRVFVAEDAALGRRVVVKVLAPELAEGLSADRFTREIRLAARLQHPNVVPVHAAGTAPDGLPYYTMPFIDGASLRERLATGPLPVAEAVAILRDMARALAYAHAQGVVHRDVKPENVLLTGGAAVVADFGIAKALSAAGAGPTLTQLGMAVGTPAYMAPEQAAGEPDVDHRADLYAWGLVAWEALAGRHPFADRPSPLAMIGAQLSRTPEPLGTVRPGTSPALAALVARCLAKDPAERPRDAHELLAALDAVALAAATPTPMVAAPGAAPGAAPTLAVLPFASLSPDPDDEYLADGITEELLGALSQLGTFRVAGRASCFAFKGKPVDHAEVAAKLGAAVVVEGSVRRAGSRVRIGASVTDAADGRQLWSARFDRELTDIFALQDEITAAVVAALRERLVVPTAPPASAAERHSGNLEAYQLYLKGRFFLAQRTAGMRLGLECFERAVALDPTYALAQVGVAETVALLGVYAFIPGRPAWERAHAALAQADAVSPGLPEALMVRGLLAMYFEWRPADAVFGRALALDPRNAQTLVWAAQDDAFHGRDEQARHRFARAVEADPYAALVHANAGFVAAWLGQPDEACRHARRALDIDPIPFARYVHAFALLEAGDAQGAYDAASRALASVTLRTRILPGFVAFLLAHLGRDVEAREVLAELEGPWPDGRPMSAVWAACAYARLGEHDAALALLERGLRERDSQLVMLRLLDRGLVVFEALRRDARVREVVARLEHEPMTRAATPRAVTPAAPDAPRTLAVLPMANTSGDPENEHFSDGLTDELIGALSAVASLRVTGRTSSFALKGKAMGVTDVARTLGVAHVLEGSVRRVGRRMKARVQLVDAGGTVGWSGAFDRTLDDVFAVQEEIAQAVVQALAVELGGTATPLVRPPTTDLEAHDWYLQGRHAMREGHPAALGRAVARFEQAVARDPAFAAAHAALARAHVLRAVGSDVLARDVVASARIHAARAASLDDGLAAAHVARGHVAFALELDLPAAGRAFRRALALDPGDADATAMLATWLMVNGDYAEAERLARHGVTLDPLVMWSHLLVGRVLLADGRPQDAMPHLRRALDLAPASAYAREYLTHALLLQGHAEEALAEARQTARDGGVRQQLLLVYVLAVTGRPEEARALVEGLVASGEPPRFPCHLAIALVGLGDHEGALEWLARAFDGPDPHLNGLTTHLPYAPLRSDARFRALIARLLLGTGR